MKPITTARITHFLREFGALYLTDVFAWAGAILIALLLRFDFDGGRIVWGNTLALIAVTTVLQLLAGWVFWLYRSRFMVGSFDEVRALVLSAASVLAGSWIFALWSGYGNGIPRSTMLISAPIALSLMGVARYLVRLSREQRLKPGANAQRTLIYGAGYVGSLTARRMLTDAAADFIPVGFLDDDVTKRNVEVRGVRVLGSLDQLAEVSQTTRAQTIMVCIGYADTKLLRKVNDLAHRAGLRVMVLPPLERILQGKSALSDVRDIQVEDLIGRHPVKLEQDSIAKYIRDEVVLVTGAGGSIGSELCRQIAHFAPKELIMLDRDETSLQQVQLSIRGHGLLDTKDVVLADIRDSEALNRIFAERRPSVVFHAAALKHLPMLEQYPDEAWKTNICGTLNVLQAAESVGVQTFVNISTDKAANPTSVLGHSKRVAEKLTAWMSDQAEGRYLSVRFGNVIGSRGSMLPTFAALIESGGPLTVTHPEVTRFFMTIPEACQLVIQAGGVGRPGEVLILDMGEPVSILEVAKRMIAESGKPIEIVFTGLRHGEKLHEELVGRGESNDRPFHPKISHARVNSISPDVLDHDGWYARLRLDDPPLGMGEGIATGDHLFEFSQEQLGDLENEPRPAQAQKRAAVGPVGDDSPASSQQATS